MVLNIRNFSICTRATLCAVEAEKVKEILANPEAFTAAAAPAAGGGGAAPAAAAPVEDAESEEEAFDLFD